MKSKLKVQKTGVQSNDDSLLLKDNYFFKPKKSLGWLSLTIISVLFGLLHG